MRRKAIWRSSASALVLAMLLVACGGEEPVEDAPEDAPEDTVEETEEEEEAPGDGNAAGTEDDAARIEDAEGADPEVAEGDPTPVRFLIAPDPLWDYMVEEGVVNEYERKYNLDIQGTSSWDEFTFFAGGHGDIVSLGTLELPILEERTGIDTVTFGKYNSFRSTPAARCDTGWETIEDAIDAGVDRFGTNSAVSATILWDLYLRETLGVPFEVGNPETPFELFVQDHFVLGEMLRGGDLQASIVIPEAIIADVVDGTICQMYDGRPSWQVIRDILPNPEHKGVLSNGFTSTKEFYDNNPEAVAGFLAMWEEGLRLWDENYEEIVRRYPHHFVVDDEEGIQWMVDYFESDKDYFADSVYLTEEWIESESAIYPLMQEHGRMAEDAPIPEFQVVEPLEPAIETE